MAEATKARKPRAYVGNFAISLGLLNVTGKLFPIVISNRNKANAFKRVCPDRTEPVAMKQRYIASDEEDAEHPKLYTQDELLLAKEVDDKLVFVDEAEVEHARESALPQNVASLSVHPAHEVAGRIWSDPDGGAWVFETPDGPHGAALVTALSNPDHVFLAITNLRGREALCRLRTWEGRIVVERVLWPEEVNEYEPVEVDGDPKLDAALAEMTAKLEVSFDPESYQSSTRAALADLEARLSKTDGAKIERKAKAEKATGGTDLLAAIEAFNGGSK